MRLPSIERLASGLRQAPHEYRPSLGVFPDISVDAIARDVKVVEKGKESGKLELPTSSSGSLDETEYAIIERIFSDRKAAHHTLLDQLTTCTERLTALDFHGRFTIIQNAAPAAVSEFGTEARQGRDELYRLRRTLLEHEQERDDFKSYNRLRRAPRLSSPVTKFFKVSFLVFLFVSETYINAVFLAKGNALGFIGGAAEALVFATLNVLTSFGIGLGGLRYLNHRNLLAKVFGLLSFLVWIAFAVLLNLALAHYREVSGALYDDAGAQVITRLWQTPVGLTDIKSWLFFGIGLLWSVLALIEGVFYTDPYPGYAALEGRVRKSHEDYRQCKNELIDRLRDVQDDASHLMEEAQNDSDLVPTFASLVQRRADAFLINPDQLFYDRRIQLLTLAARYTLPAIYPAREWAEAGGLMSYGSSFMDLHRQAGIYTGRVLKGEKPADLPILRASKFELIVNIQTVADFAFNNQIAARARKFVISSFIR